MPHIAIVTPSFLPDLDRCELLAEGIARFASPEHRHVVIVPRCELNIFDKRLERYGVVLIAEEELLPSLIRRPFTRKWRLTTLGWPVRGWIRQQVVKIAYGCHSTADAVVFADSDTCIVKPFDATLMLRPSGRVKLLADPTDGNTALHHPWYRRAGRLLGIPAKDYYGFGFIGHLVPWVPEHVRGLARRIEAVMGSDWRTVLLHEKTISEYVLYGVFVQEVVGLQRSRHVAESAKPVIEYWDKDELSDERLLEFISTLGDGQLAIHIQSKTRYSFELYARAVRGLWRSAGGSHTGAG